MPKTRSYPPAAPTAATKPASAVAAVKPFVMDGLIMPSFKQIRRRPGQAG
jgi:hypothetical protein